MKAEDIKIENLISSFEKLGYPVFKNQTNDNNLNIFGIRTADLTPNSFNDFVGIFWLFQNKWTLWVFNATTDPGLYWLKNPMNVKGTAILVPGHYPKAYIYGYHRGYPALQQVNPMNYYRDNNRDNYLDMKGMIYKEIAATNIHHAGNTDQIQLVDKWSAGCQVIEKISDWNKFLTKIILAKSTFGNSFSYTLITESQYLF